MAAIGHMDSFDSTVEDWTTYVERVEQYCLANEVESERKVAVLLSVMGAKTYNLLRSLIAPAKPATKTFDQIVETLKRHLNPTPLVIAERFRFHKRNQSRAESVSEYMAELRRLAEHCQFGEGLSDALRDWLVCGLHNEGVQKRLLTEDNLTLTRALEIAISVETAAKDAGELQDVQLTEMLDKHRQVFREGIGTLKHIKARIELEKDAKPRFHKARLVPYALRPKVEAELQHLVD
ncbi:hypothetical protein AAFF_G00223430 [Aldrovandia affinis]|uniref:Retrotransposon gag domain-containing protein n=1 Tax=Aldrovandia affinis TaxID=143900 RepID=A0AAD7TAP4_9TELE|nr:hypothetical protein AAFF_G00223430 [Aldrovandia affinis]